MFLPPAGPVNGRRAVIPFHGMLADRRTGRHDLLNGLGAFDMNAAVDAATPARSRSTTRQPRSQPRRIDVHYHIAPPAWAALLSERRVMQPAWKDWSPAKAVADMDRDGVERSIVSVTTPGVWFGDADQARRLARECNDFAAKMRSDHPGRFGIFAAIPLPDRDGSLREIEYALDTLKADGIGLLTSYDDKWLGDAAFAPVFEELNRRKAVVYTHPTVPNCCRNLSTGLSPALIEYGTDTTRAVAQLVFGGAAQKYPDLRLIFSHAGGAVPFLIERFIVAARAPDMAAALPQGPEEVLRRFYYDTAQAAMAPPMAALRRVVPVSHILFGTDYPYRTAAEHAKELRQSRVFNAKEIAAIERDNALELLSR
jgi:6-methylsalicylate decarboxylase